MPHDDAEAQATDAMLSALPDGGGDGKDGVPEPESYRILVVDPDPALAEMARAVLAGYRHQNAEVEILTAASAAEARAIIGTQSNLALVLLEAVLETERAGLDLVNHIRKDLGNHRVRLVVVTGHPDKVPEHAAIEAYELSDYRTKDTFTAEALRTRAIGALRTYATLQALAASRKGMARMMVATVGLLEMKSPDQLFAHLLPRVTGLLGMGSDALLCMQGDTLPRDRKIRVRAGSGRFKGLRDVELAAIGEPRIVAALERLGPSSETILEPGLCALRLRAHGGIVGMIYVEGRRAASSAQEWQIVELFRNKAAIALENAMLIEELNGSQRATVMALASLAEHKDAGPSGHLERISRMTTEIARELRAQQEQARQEAEKKAREQAKKKAGEQDAQDGAGNKLPEVPVPEIPIDDDLIDKIGLASMLHDVGMLSVADETLIMPGELAMSEVQAIQRHTEIGCRILTDAARPLRGRSVLSIAAEIARYHHERHDGTGYMEGLSGDAIPISARITAVADVFDALITERPYRRAMPLDDAVALIEGRAGSEFDPRVVKAFLAVVARLRESEPDWFPRSDNRPEALVETIGRRLRSLFGRRPSHVS